MKTLDLLKANTKKTVIIPMAQNEELMECIKFGLSKNIADFILIGKKTDIQIIAEKTNTDLSKTEILEESDEKKACYLAASYLKTKKAQIIMKGLTQTSTFTKALLQKEFNLIPENGLISHVAIFDIPSYHKPIILTDAAINILPTIEQKVRILKNAINIAIKLGIKHPKVACIAPVEKVNAKIQSTLDAEALCKRKKEFPEAIVEGPLGFDVAVSKKAAEIKGITSIVAGDSDILLMPELNSANAVYKTLTQFSNAIGGAILAGLKVPIILTSRADSEEVKQLSLQLALAIA